jgi:hypothetical protein
MGSEERSEHAMAAKDERLRQRCRRNPIYEHNAVLCEEKLPHLIERIHRLLALRSGFCGRLTFSLRRVTPGGGLRALRGTLGALCILIMVMMFREHIWGTRPGIATSAEAAPRMHTDCGQFENRRLALSTTRSLRGCCVRIAGRWVWSATRLT